MRPLLAEHVHFKALPGPGQCALRKHLSEKGVRLAQKVQVVPCIPVGIQL